MHNVSGKPVILGEFSFTAADSNMPNTHGARAGHPERTQTKRTAKYQAYVRQLIAAPYILGYGWWNSYDEPSTGRWPDGENCASSWRFACARARGRAVRRSTVSLTLRFPPPHCAANYGIYSLAGDPYTILTHAMTAFHAEAAALHAGGRA